MAESRPARADGLTEEDLERALSARGALLDALARIAAGPGSVGRAPAGEGSAGQGAESTAHAGD